jgi:hypothetical protein
MTFNDCVDCPTEALAAMPCGCPPNAFARCAGGWIRCNERYAAWSRWQSESLLGRMVAADRKPEAGTPATDEPRGKMLHAALVTGRYTETRCPVPADDPPATDELPDDESSPRADAFGNEYPTDFDLAEQYYGKPKGEPATDDREFWEQAKDAQAEVDSWPEWKRGAAARARVSPATDESAAPERLTFELEELGKHPLTGESTSRLLAGLRHPVAYVREGALRGVEPHLGLEYFRDVVGRIARYDDDADVREIARDILGEDESAAEDRSAPPPGWRWAQYYGGVLSPTHVVKVQPGPFLLSSAWAHHDAHPAVAELARARNTIAVVRSCLAKADALNTELRADTDKANNELARVREERGRFAAEAIAAEAKRDEWRTEATEQRAESERLLGLLEHERRRTQTMQGLLARCVPLIMEVEGPGGTADPVVVQLLADIAAIDSRQHTVASTDQPSLSEVTTSTMPRSAPVASEGDGPLGDGGIEE